MLWPDSDKENDVQRAGATRRTVSSPTVVLANPEVADKLQVASLLSIPMVAISRWS